MKPETIDLISRLLSEHSNRCLIDYTAAQSREIKAMTDHYEKELNAARIARMDFLEWRKETTCENT